MNYIILQRVTASPSFRGKYLADLEGIKWSDDFNDSFIFTEKESLIKVSEKLRNEGKTIKLCRGEWICEDEWTGRKGHYRYDVSNF
ncbi:MAG: hypothetical protein LBE36_06730 [Flavobacteriaceae bacterium]|jgi:hypothetical protein|nr:hypothetical protein [Flavobacteriaceae bacterium]